MIHSMPVPGTRPPFPAGLEGQRPGSGAGTALLMESTSNAAGGPPKWTPGTRFPFCACFGSLCRCQALRFTSGTSRAKSFSWDRKFVPLWVCFIYYCKVNFSEQFQAHSSIARRMELPQCSLPRSCTARAPGGTLVTAHELTDCHPESTVHVRAPLVACSLGNGK